jgi:hypothetical protein
MHQALRTYPSPPKRRIDHVSATPLRIDGSQHPQAEGRACLELGEIAAQQARERTKPALTAATADMRRALQPLPSRLDLKPEYFPNTYFLCGPTGAQGRVRPTNG